MDISNKDIERRIDSRKPYSGYIFFATKGQLIEGELANFSQYGLFIKTYEILTLGEFITVAIPYMEDKNIKVQGQVLWRNHEGYGVELVKSRKGNNSKIVKLEAKIRS